MESFNDLKSKGITILYISHKMNEIFQMCDRATVLRDGKYIKTIEMAKTTRDEVIQAMVGRDISLFAKRTMPCQKQGDVNRCLRVEQSGIRSVP